MYLWYPIVLSHEEVNKLMRKDLIICLTNLGYVHCVIIRKERQTDRQTEKQTDRQRNRQTEKKTGRQTDRERLGCEEKRLFREN